MFLAHETLKFVIENIFCFQFKIFKSSKKNDLTSFLFCKQVLPYRSIKVHYTYIENHKKKKKQ